MALSQLQGEHQWDLVNMELSMKAATFFDQIMVPDFAASTSLNLPLDIFSHMPEQDWLSEDIDIFGLDFTPTIDEAFETSNMSLPLVGKAEAGVHRHDSAHQDRDESARQRHAIFQRSPWLWKPEAKSHAFSEHRDLPLDESEIDLSASPHQPFLPALSMHTELSTQSRDRIFQMVLRAAKSHVSIPRFPSAKCLNLLLRVGLAKRMETDAWIHPYTIDAETARPELLTTLIAAGCVCFGIPSVSKTGLILFEIVRVALNRLIEDDNSVIRDLQYLQACMIWIDITAFCGYKRKMKIAEHSLQPLVTALRRAGRFDRVAYTSNSAGDRSDTDTLENKWAIWAEQESYKRLIHHLFEHDMLTTITKVRNPLVSYAEMTLPLPACRELWLAPTAEAWNVALLENSTSDKKYSELSLRDLLADHELLGCLPVTIDKSVARAAHLHGLAAETWGHFQQSSVVNSPFASTADASAKLWLQTRHQKLYQMLQAIRAAGRDSSAVTALLHEFLMLSMHVNPDDVTRFAGKCGEAEAHRAYQELQAWSQTKRARTAIFHAGQVLRLGREVPPYQLRGADAFIIYHALMVLWAYGMMQRDFARRTRSNTPVGNTLPREDDIPIFLDEKKDGALDAFLLLGTGRPCLRIRQAGIRQLQCCDLQHPQVVMQVGVRVLEDNYPNELRKNLPQLIKSLCELMGELGVLT
ncbi:hypothetical protein Slin15195_G060130 [Septoria linicola]|uniref:Xylanolytic transcriptional activator regulatory domain-containing protein n=1 Tax=Septoria linicola TaxID=215465 RepID=A0A9Q9EJY9_9PEZI|nr:hypothetical protein Slin15195_G060130 [Septoria linicola]